MIAPRWLPLALVATFAVSACSSGDEPADQSSRFSRSAPPAGGSTPARAAALSPERYSAELTAQAGPVAKALAGIGRSRSLKALGERLERARVAAAEAAAGLGVLVPPADAAAEHADYVAALRDLTDDLDDLRESVEGRRLCTSGAVLARLGRAEGFEAVRSAGGDLAAKGDYPAEVATVKVPAARDRRLANGAFVRSGARSGRGTLTVDNGTGKDAVLTLVRGGTKAVSFYVRKKRKAKIGGVPDGTYRIYFTGGADWDGKARAFTRDCGFQRFEEPVKFTTVRTGNLIRFSTWTLTLQPVAGGNARTAEVDPDGFPR
ncbi:hypothetical protein Sru01_23070 [Sphaerisporangium rufum]|uniref:Lipoprotein n=1 Tax=Sphaerisporangium rufum TaxID=1381558 RepID=A0A919V4J3_9ACTN|nr:hypothetical protein [Sphaerisporangium rufum]GII77325.1 hypothetical protein Sru01_23070 [Sphaerisporangium rufum]